MHICITETWRLWIRNLKRLFDNVNIEPANPRQHVSLPYFYTVAHMMVHSREYWLIYRGPGFLVVVWFGFSAIPSPPPLVSKFSLLLSLPECRLLSLELTEMRGGGEGGGGGAKSYYGEKAWSYINHSKLPDIQCNTCHKKIHFLRVFSSFTKFQCGYRHIGLPVYYVHTYVYITYRLQLATTPEIYAIYIYLQIIWRGVLVNTQD